MEEENERLKDAIRKFYICQYVKLDKTSFF